MLPRLRIEPRIEESVRVAAFLQDTVKHLRDRRGVLRFLGGVNFRQRDVEFRQTVYHFAAVIDEPELAQITGGMVRAQQVVIAQAHGPIEILALAGEPYRRTA